MAGWLTDDVINEPIMPLITLGWFIKTGHLIKTLVEINGETLLKSTVVVAISFAPPADENTECYSREPTLGMRHIASISKSELA